MIDLNDDDYKNIAEKLIAAIGDAEFYNGSVECEVAGYDSVLTSTLMIYREPLRDPADPARSANRITGIVPVWWEFHVYGECGELTNGFSWGDLKEYLI